jgi:hypothetical protein
LASRSVNNARLLHDNQGVITIQAGRTGNWRISTITRNRRPYHCEEQSDEAIALM